MDMTTLGAAIAVAKKAFPQVSADDAGKLMTVGDDGKWLAADLEVGQGEVAVDTTLLVSGAAADAKVTGDKLGELKSAIDNQSDRLDLVVTDGGHTINLLDAYAVTNGYRVNPSTGQVDLNYTYGFTTDFIPVNPGDGYCFTIPYNDARAMTSEINRYAFYDSSKNFISGGSNYATSKNDVLVIPDGVAYGKFSAYMGTDYDQTSQWIENYKVMFICIPDGTVPTDLYLQPYVPYLIAPERILDKTLNGSGYAPDSKAVGDMLVPLTNVMRFKPCYDHLFVNRGGNNVTIPHESVYHVRLSKSFGFDVIEANLYPTSDGVYIVNHTDGGKFGNYFYHVDGVTDISNTLVSSVTWDWIVANVRYNSQITKYRTRPCRLEEFLAECKQQNLIPFINAATAGVTSIIDGYMGRTNYVAYNGSRSLSPSALIYHWKTNLTNKDDILEYCESIGRPFIYGLGNPNAFTDAELKEIVDLLHANGYWIGTAYADDNWSKLSQMGFDVIGATKYVNRIPLGNKYNIVSCFGFSGFDYTNATESNAVLTFSADGTLSPKVTSEAYEACMLDLEIVFDGELTVPQFGEHISAITYTSDGSHPVFVTIPIINGGLNIVVSVKSGTVITDCKFRASTI